MTIPSVMLRPPLLRSRILRPPRLPRARLLSTSTPIIRIQNGTFYQNYPSPDDEAKNQNSPLFSDLNFEILSRPFRSKDAKGKKVPEQIAIIGSHGRTQLLEILRGQHVCLPPNARSYPYLSTDDVAKKDPRLRFVGNAIEYVGFGGQETGAAGARGAYMSARYESFREETDWTLRQYLKGQTSLNPLEGEEDGTLQDPQLFDQAVTDLRLQSLLDMPVANLSNGQTRRARIAKALLKKPLLLLLDDPFMGLDPSTRQSISSLLQRLAAKANPRLILALRPQDPVPDWVTHMTVIGHKNKVLARGTRAKVEQVFNVWNETQLLRPSTNKVTKPIYDEALELIEAGYLDRPLMFDLNILNLKAASTVQDGHSTGEPLIEMEGVRVQYGDKVVLGDWQQKVGSEMKDGLHWRVRRGQRWAVLGANGSGKTTLVSLITSDHPQAYALPIKLFGRSRLPEPGRPAISLFELQSRIGHSSPEIHAFFPRQLTLRQSLESAFAETFLGKPSLNHDRDLDVSAMLRHFKPALDPNAAATADEKPLVSIPDRRHFPKLDTPGKLPKPYLPDDYETDYADSVTFGQLNTAQQRVILFLRALVHRPDLVILDEPFSGMPATLRDQCMHFLEVGEPGRSRMSTVIRRTTTRDTWVKGFNPNSRPMRFYGLSEEQALIMISHTQEEIPDIVRHYMRLPSENDDGELAMDFRLGLLKRTDVMRDPLAWNTLWSPPAQFDLKARLVWRKIRAKDGSVPDDALYHYRSI